jgi:hypothetical protein
MDHLTVLMHLDSPVCHVADPPGMVFAGSLPDYGLDPRRFLAFIPPEVQSVAPLRRSSGGSIAAITEWHYSTAH